MIDPHPTDVRHIDLAQTASSCEAFSKQSAAGWQPEVVPRGDPECPLKEMSALGQKRTPASIAQRCMEALQRDIVEVLWSAPANALARAVRHDHLADIAAFRRHERIGEVLLIFVDALFECCGCLDALGGSARRQRQPRHDGNPEGKVICAVDHAEHTEKVKCDRRKRQDDRRQENIMCGWGQSHRFFISPNVHITAGCCRASSKDWSSACCAASGALSLRACALSAA